MPFPDYLDQNPKIIFFTDFDGTITRHDCCDWLVETEGYGPEKLRQSCRDILDGKILYRDGCDDQCDSIKLPFNKCMEKVLANIELDEYFIAFYKWTVSASIPVVVLSGGLTPMIHAVLSKWIGPEAENIEVIANAVVPRAGFDSVNEEGGAWKIEYRDNSEYGHDKASSIRPYAKFVEGMEEGTKPILLYAGDGVSDISAAKQTELLFAKKEQDLVTYCQQERISFTQFESWRTILETTQDIYHGRKSVDQVVQNSLHIAQLSNDCS